MGKPEMPWSKFYWSDWESDEGLRQCSLAAQGLWMRMLCVCAKSDPPGYLTIRGEPLDVSGVAKAASADPTEVATLMEELDRWGVFSRDRKGRIYSRRMIRDAKKAAQARKIGKRGGNPNLRKQSENPAQDNPPDKTQRPETRDHTSSGTNVPDASASQDDLKTHLFNGCLDWLAKQSGKPSDKLRPQMGRWIKDHGEGVVLEAVTRAQTQAAVEPIAFINGCLGGTKRDWSKYDVPPE